MATIADSDAILVMEAGRMAEYGPPEELLADPGSLYHGLVHADTMRGVQS